MEGAPGLVMLEETEAPRKLLLAQNTLRRLDEHVFQAVAGGGYTLDGTTRDKTSSPTSYWNCG